MPTYNTDWAVNPVKLKRATDVLEKKVKDGEIKSFGEKEVRELYEQFGGAIRE